MGGRGGCSSTFLLSSPQKNEKQGKKSMTVGHSREEAMSTKHECSPRTRQFVIVKYVDTWLNQQAGKGKIYFGFN
jgi:hypothetical protein